MRVLHLLDSINRGGAETLALDVCRNASRFGIELTVATCGGGTMEGEFEASGVDVVRLPRRLPIDPKVVQDLRRLIQERGVQVVHGHQAVDGAHIHLAARGTDAKKVLTYHGFVPDAKNRLTLKYLIPRMDANVVVSEALRGWLREKDGLDTAAFKVLHNGVDANRLRPTGRSVRAELKIPPAALLAGMVGNFYRDPRKDQSTVANALPSVFASVPSAHFVFAGGVEPGAEPKLAECREACERAGIAHRVHFLGPRSDVPDVLASLDLFVMSSIQEGMPIALNEAMLAGVPVLASDIAPHVEASANGQYAMLFKTKDPDDLAAKMTSLLAEAEDRVSLAAKAKRYADENFSIDAHLRRLVELYGSLLAGGAR